MHHLNLQTSIATPCRKFFSLHHLLCPICTTHSINMAVNQKLEYADIAANFGSLSPLIGHPNVHSIRAFEDSASWRPWPSQILQRPPWAMLGSSWTMVNMPCLTPPPTCPPSLWCRWQCRKPMLPKWQQLCHHQGPTCCQPHIYCCSNHEIVHCIIKEVLEWAIPNDYKPTLRIRQCGFGNQSVQDIFLNLYDW